MKSLFYTVIIALLNVTWMNWAFIYEIKVLSKWDTQLKRKKYFIGCSDFHDKANSANKEQRDKLESLFAACNGQEIELLLEDLSSPNEKGQFNCGKFYVNSKGGVLGGLASLCRNLGLNVQNIEFRYCRVAALGPVLNNIQADLNAFPSVKTITVQAMTQEITDALGKMHSFADGAIAQDFYREIAQEVLSQCNTLNLDQAQQSISHYLAKNSCQHNRLDFLKELLTFDSGILDANLVHHSLQSPKAKVIAIAGGAHIARVCEILEKMGFVQEKVASLGFAKERDLNRCLGSHIIEGAFCLKPQSIKLDLLEKFLTKK